MKSELFELRKHLQVLKDSPDHMTSYLVVLYSTCISIIKTLTLTEM